MHHLNKNGSTIFKAITIVTLCLYVLLMVLALWNLVGETTIKFSLFLLLFCVFNALLTFRTYKIKFALPGWFSMIVITLSILKNIGIKIDIGQFFLMLLISGLASSIFVLKFNKYYYEN